MIIVTCPKCQHKKQLAKPPEGGKYECPGCGAVFVMKSKPRASGLGQQAPNQIKSSAPAAKGKPSGPARDGDEDTLQVQSAVIRLGEYLVLEMIARTPILKTYLAENTKAERKCVVKYLPSKFSANEEATTNFLSVGRELVKIRHPNIANVEYAGQFQEITFLAMEYVQGPSGRQMTLAEYLKLHPKGRASEKRAVKWAKQLSSALCAIHSQGLIHGALRPENILIDVKGNVKLIDTGLAKAISIKEDLLTTPEAVDYMAPELRRGESEPDHRSDMYSMGILFYRLLTGRLPGKFAELPSKTVPGIAEGWDNIIQCCTSDVPDDRFPSTDQLSSELEKLSSVESADIPEAIEVPDDAEDGGPVPVRATAQAQMDVSQGGGSGFDDDVSDLFVTEKPIGRKTPSSVHDDVDYDSSNYLTGMSNLTQMPQEENSVQDDDPQSHDTLAGMAVSSDQADPQDSLSGMAVASNRTSSDKRRRMRSIVGKSNSNSKIYGLLVGLLVIGLAFAVLYIAFNGDFSQRVEKKVIQTPTPAANTVQQNPQPVPQPQPQPQPRPQPTQQPTPQTPPPDDPNNSSSVIQSPEEVFEGTKPKTMTGTSTDEPVKTPPPASFSSFTNSVGMKLIFIPAGDFSMGSPASEQDRKTDEKQHKVKLSSGFYLAEKEVTQQQWKMIMNEERSRFKGGGDLPVDDIANYDDAEAFCRRLSEKEGKKYRLPTEAEWEYACRAGTTTAYNTGATIDLNKAKFYSQAGKEVVGERTEKTGSFPPNAWGFYDMHGNVLEWCSDYYGDYPGGDATDPKGPKTGQGRILRGGSWSDEAKECRSAARFYYMIGAPFRTGTVGLRVAMDP